MSEFGGILIDYDSVIQPSVDLEGTPFSKEMGERQIDLRAALDQLASSGFLIAFESKMDYRALGSSIFREGLSCDGYIGRDPEDSDRDMRLETFQDQVKNAEQFIYVCNNSNRIHFAIGLGFKCITPTALVSSAENLIAMQPAKRVTFSPSDFLAHLEKAALRRSGLLLPMLPARFVTNAEIRSRAKRWTDHALPILNQIAPMKRDANTGLQYFVPYYSGEPSDQLGFRLWKRVKDWNGSSSGPNPNLLDLNFIAATMTAGIWTKQTESITYIPSSPATAAKPAATSKQLAQRVSGYLGVPLVSILRRREHQEFELIPQYVNFTKFDSMLLIDDQVTKGLSMANGLSLIQEQIPNTSISQIVWSRSAK